MTREENLNRKAVGYGLAIRDIMIMHGAKKEPSETISKIVQIAYLAGATESDISHNDEFAQGVLRGAAINLITWIDYNMGEGSMCLSNTECKDIEDALVNGDWNKIYAYMKKKLEKQASKPKRMAKWTDEDEEILMHIIQDVELLLGYEDERFEDERKQSLVWLKSLKQRMEEQQ